MNNLQIFRKPKVSEVNKVKNAFAQAIYDKRTAAGISQQALADIAGIDRKTINRIENGHFSPNLDTITRLAIVLKLETSKYFKV
jgi:putative transcriptional regulator